MTKSKLISIVQQLRKEKHFISMSVLRKFSQEAHDFMMQETSFLPAESNFRERLYCIENGIHERLLCPVCRENYLKFLKSGKYSDGCCTKCALASQAHKDRMLEKYGCESPNQAASVKEHKAESLLKSYGVTNSFQIPEVKALAREKSLAEHGVEHWTNRKQGIKTYQEKTGYANPSQDPAVKEKKAKTCLENLGVDNPSKSEEISKKKVKTCLANYGVEYGYMLDRHIIYNSISGLNKRMYQILDDAGVRYEKEFRIYADGTYRAYDILITDAKLLIELNGDFWHANPKMFSADDLLNFPHIGKVLAKDVWKSDEAKRKLAEKNGYRVLYFWERDFKKMSDAEVLTAVRSSCR